MKRRSKITTCLKLQIIFLFNLIVPEIWSSKRFEAANRFIDF